jgi:hypothetical protein
MKVARFRSCFGADWDARRDYRRKAPWIGKAHAFHEAPAEPVLAAFEPPSGFEEKRNQANGTEEATGVSEAVGTDFTRRKKTPPRESSSGRRSGSRAVKRDSPWPRSYRKAPSQPVPASQVFGRAR